MAENYDIVILGTGPAASRIAAECAERFRVAIVDSREIGGTCALRGCNPKKVFVRAAELVDWAQRSDGELANSGEVAIDWHKLVEFKRTFTDPVPEKSEASFRKKGIAVYQAPAKFVGPQTLSVGGAQLTAERIVVCTGAEPVRLPFPGAEHVTYSDQFLELDFLPQRVLFIGGGYISFEFAHVAHRAGSNVRMLEREDRVLRGFEEELVDKLLDHSREIGIAIETDAEVSEVEKTSEGDFQVTVDQGGKKTTYRADLVVHGAGRVPAIAALDLKAAGVDANRQGIVVNEYLQSVSNPHVYAAGDVAATDQPKLTPVANQEGRAVALNLLEGNKHRPDYGVVPRVVFTVPALASIGLTEAEAHEQGRRFSVESGEMTEWSSIRKIGGKCAWYKLLIDAETNEFCGAHLLAPQAAETINLFALAMKFHLTAQQMKSVLFVFPTFAHDVRSMT